MKKLAFASAVMAFSTIIFTGSLTFAGPMAGDKVTLDYGPNHKSGFSGGDFLLESTTSDYAFVTFCLEKNEYFRRNRAYTIDSVTNYANKGGNGYDAFGSTNTKDYISDATKWLMNEYTFNYDGLKQGYESAVGSNVSGYDFSYLVQNTIWDFEDEHNFDSSLNSYVMSEMGADFSLGHTLDYLDNVQVVNIVSYYDNGDFVKKYYKQSQLIANPVPEPATMLLFGTGMAGLAALRRKRR